jgi:hypothetical protein
MAMGAITLKAALSAASIVAMHDDAVDGPACAAIDHIAWSML